MSTKEAEGDSSDGECPTCGEEFKNPHGMRIHHHQRHGFSVAPEDDSGPECPTCGRGDFSNETGMKQHHAKSHGESIAGVEVSCEWCGELKRVDPHETEDHGRHFCNNICQGKWKVRNLVGENRPLWGGGPLRYGEGWTYRLKEKIRDRQGRLCGGCGTHESECCRRLDVHHIQKARSFDDDQKRNDDSILVALCPTCHPVGESMAPLRPQTPHLD